MGKHHSHCIRGSDDASNYFCLTYALVLHTVECEASQPGIRGLSLTFQAEHCLYFNSSCCLLQSLVVVQHQLSLTESKQDWSDIDSSPMLSNGSQPNRVYGRGLDSDDSGKGSSEDLPHKKHNANDIPPCSASKLANCILQPGSPSSSEADGSLQNNCLSTAVAQSTASGSVKLGVTEAARAHAQGLIQSIKQQKKQSARPPSRQGHRASNGSEDHSRELRPATPPGSALPKRNRGLGMVAPSIVADILVPSAQALGPAHARSSKACRMALDTSRELEDGASSDERHMSVDEASSVGARSSIAGNSARSIAIGAALLARRACSKAASASASRWGSCASVDKFRLCKDHNTNGHCWHPVSG